MSVGCCPLAEKQKLRCASGDRKDPNTIDLNVNQCESLWWLLTMVEPKFQCQSKHQK
jgi:hypothetical protein